MQERGFEELRAEFPVLGRTAYLNAGSSGPLRRRTTEAMREEDARELAEGRGGAAYVDRVLELREQVRTRMADLVGVDRDQVALTASTTDGCSLVIAGVGVAAGDEVVTTDSEHFGLLGPLHASGARVVVVRPDPEAVISAVTPRTRLLALSHVLWTTGQILPVHALRRATGLPILVDGAQSVGAISVDANGLDYYTVSGQKWLCGPSPVGALVVADADRLRTARPSYFSQLEHDPDGAFRPRAGARRFEPGWIAAATLAGMLAATDELPGWRFERALTMAERCRDLLSARGADVVTPSDSATLVAWRWPSEEPADVVVRLAAEGVVIREIPGKGRLRASVGWWTSEEDVERLANAL
jgi:L-cysteine/cystine lyase